MNEPTKKKRKPKIQCELCNYKKAIDQDCPCCNGTGIDERRWYLLVGWDEHCYRGYCKSTSKWDEAQVFINEEGMELYGYAENLTGIHKLQNEFWRNGGWFYR